MASGGNPRSISAMFYTKRLILKTDTVALVLRVVTAGAQVKQSRKKKGVGMLYKLRAVPCILLFALVAMYCGCGNGPARETAKDWYPIAQERAKEWMSDAVPRSIDTYISTDSSPLDGKCNSWDYRFASKSAEGVMTVTIKDGKVEDASESNVARYTDYEPIDISRWEVDSDQVAKMVVEKYEKEYGERPKGQIQYHLRNGARSIEKQGERKPEPALIWSVGIINKSSPLVVEVDANTGEYFDPFK